MAVKIRLKRMGKIRAPFYRVVVMDSRTKRDGRAIAVERCTDLAHALQTDLDGHGWRVSCICGERGETGWDSRRGADARRVGVRSSREGAGRVQPSILPDAEWCSERAAFGP